MNADGTVSVARSRVVATALVALMVATAGCGAFGGAGPGDETTTATDGEPETTAASQTTRGETTAADGTTTGNETGVENATNASDARVVFNNQTTNGSTVTVERVTIPNESGFVVVYRNLTLTDVEPNPNSSQAGTSRVLEAGTHTNVTVNLTTPLTENQTLTALAAADVDENARFESSVDEVLTPLDQHFGVSTAYVTVTGENASTSA